MNVPWAVPDIGRAETEEVTETIESTWITMGDRVENFEDRLCKFIGVDHAIGVTSGTAALDVALKAIGIEANDRVILPAMTYIATANAVRYQHAAPVLADISPETYNIDPNAVRDRISQDTDAILPIDYGGQTADYEALRSLADKHDIALVADCAESFSAAYDGEMAGSLADVSITSFHAAKMLTTAEGGMVFTDDDEIARRCRIIRNQGEDPQKKYRHIELGHNYRMSDLHAAVGLAQLERVHEFAETRERIAGLYTSRLGEYSDRIKLPSPVTDTDHSWFLYSIVLENREKVRQYLDERGVGTRVTWPIPVHQQPIYASQYADQSYPVAERFSDGVLSLPMHNQLTIEEADYVADTLVEAIDKYVDSEYELV